MVKALFLLALLLSTTLSGQEIKLEAFLEAPKPWYPGQVGNFIYKISYRGQIQLIEEKLPLLDLEGFEKLGDKTFDSYSQGGFSVQEITQKVRSINPGTFIAEPSILKGVHYLIRGGKKQVVPPPLESLVKPLSVVITPFPLKNQPSLFEGSVGSFHFNLSPITQKNLRVGDWFDVVITAKGSPFLDLLQPPNIECQPGFSGFFQQSDAPFSTEIDYQNMTKTFHFRFTPTTALTDKIPSITWATFDPETDEYLTWKSDPIPIQIDNPTPTLTSTTLKEVHMTKSPYALRSLPRASTPSFVGKFLNLLSRNFNFILLFMTIVVVLAYYITPYIKRWIHKLKQDPLYQMKDELYQTKDTTVQMRAWDQVISTRLLEKGYINLRGEWTTREPLLDQVKEFLWDLKQSRFSKEKGGVENLAQQGEYYYKKVDKLPTQ